MGAVALTAEDQRALRSLRWKWGWLLAIGWVVAWWVYLDASHRAELARLKDCERVSGISNTISCHATNANKSVGSGVATALGVVFAFLTSPLGFVVAHYTAKGQVERARQVAIDREATALRVQQQEEEAARQSRLETAEAANKGAKAKILREEFILKLGSVSDRLKILAGTTDQDAALLLQQGIEDELRSLVAKHQLDALRAIITKDATIQFKLRSLGPRLIGPPIDSDDARLLLSLLPR